MHVAVYVATCVATIQVQKVLGSLAVVCRQLEAHEAIGEWSRMAPFRIMSMDIECLGRKGCFPEADKDPVIQIASVVSVAGAKEPMLHHIVTLDTCEAIPGSQVEAFDNESDMLLRCVIPCKYVIRNICLLSMFHLGIRPRRYELFD